jgi:hypothetical protein
MQNMKLCNMDFMLNCVDYSIRGVLGIIKWHWIWGWGIDSAIMREYERDIELLSVDYFSLSIKTSMKLNLSCMTWVTRKMSWVISLKINGKHNFRLHDSIPKKNNSSHTVKKLNLTTLWCMTRIMNPEDDHDSIHGHKNTYFSMFRRWNSIFQT